MLTTTLAEIRKHGPCEDGFAKIRNHLGVSAAEAKTHDKPFPLSLLLETNGLDDTLWVFDRVAPQSMKDAFLIRRLDTGDYSALKSLRLNPVDADWWRNCEAAIVRVVDLLQRRIAGEDVAEEMIAARAAADAARAAARAAYDAASAAADDAYAAAYAAASAAADAAAYAAYAAYAAAYAADAADAAAKADLIAVMEG